MVIAICVFIVSVTIVVCSLGGKYMDNKKDDLSCARYKELHRELSEIKSMLKDKNGGKE